MILLFTALGVLQACVIDQSLFSVDYQGYEGWAEAQEATRIPGLGVSAYNVVNFIGGHLVFSFAAPVAVIESWRPDRAASPWLSRTGLVVAVFAYLGTAALILSDPESRSASPAQLGAAVAAVVLLGLLAWIVGRFRSAAGDRLTQRRARRPVVVLLATLPLALVHSGVPATWVGVAAGLAALGVVLTGVARQSGAAGWSPRHVAAVAMAFLIVRGALAFTYFPLSGEVEPFAKYAHNTVFLLLVLVFGRLALRPGRAEVERRA